MNDDEIAALIKESVKENLTNALTPSKDKLLAEYKERLPGVIATHRMDNLRALAAEYEGREGITYDDLDISPKGSAAALGRINDLPGR